MALFKPFLSLCCQFSWSPELEVAFQASKVGAVVRAVRMEIEIYNLQSWTCLQPDWSKGGISYSFPKQHCSSGYSILDCCTGGWRISLACSQVLSPAELRYAVEGPGGLAMAWGRGHMRNFTQGCNNLLSVTVQWMKLQTCLFRLKQRSLPWRFNIVYLPRKSNCTADAACRLPVA